MHIDDQHLPAVNVVDARFQVRLVGGELEGVRQVAESGAISRNVAVAGLLDWIRQVVTAACSNGR
jgi:hypothetical protein